MPSQAFLFTDIEDSTAKWENDHRAMSRLLMQHDRVLGDAIKANGGQVVKHMGDGIFAVLPQERALACALDIQRRIGRSRWEPFENFRVRVGLHVGVAEERGGDYFGPVINCAARVMSKAGGGQILASHEALRESVLPKGASSRDAGVFRLKGIDKPLRLFHLLHPDLEKRELQAIRADEGPQWNLPESKAPLKGRDSEMRAALEMIEKDQPAVLTIGGEEGSGKTAFALELARKIAPGFSDGACFVDLAQEDERDTLSKALADSLGLSINYAGDADHLVFMFLAEKQLLLVLNNFEHVASKALFVLRLLTMAPSVRVVTTARARLGLKGEGLFELGGLSLGTEGGAITLFNAEALSFERPLAGGERQAALELCTLLGGNALALRLAAALLPRNEPYGLLKRLRDIRAALTVGGGFGMAESLRIVFQAHWEDLPQSTAEAMARCSTLRAGFSREACDVVAGLDESGIQLLEARGLLRDSEAGLAFPGPVRRLAQEQLALEVGGRFKAMIRHRDYYMRFLAGNSKELEGGSKKAELIKSLDQNFTNVREAWHRACETEALEQLAAASAPLGQYLDFRNKNREGVRLYGQAIERMEVHGRSRALAELYMQRANSLTYFGAADESLHLLNLALDYWRHAGDRQKEATALTHLANVSGYAGIFQDQIEFANQALAVWSSLDNQKGLAWATGHLAGGLMRQGKLAQARAAGEKAMAIYERVGDPAGLLWVMGVVAEVAFIMGDIDRARVLCYRSLESARPLDAAWAMAASYIQLATIAELQSSYRESLHFLKRSKELFAKQGRSPQRFFTLRNLTAQVNIASGDYAHAEALLAESLDPKKKPESSQDLGWPMNLLAQLRLHQGDFQGSIDLCEQGLKDGSLSADGGSWFKENLAQATFALGDTSRALQLTHESLSLARESGRLRGQAWGANRLGMLLLALGRLVEAREALEKAKDLHLQLSEPQGQASDDMLLARLCRLEGNLFEGARLAEKACDAYTQFGMPRGLALANLELGACLMALKDYDLSREQFIVALRVAARIGALPVVYRALRRLAELKAGLGEQHIAAEILASVVSADEADAETRDGARAALAPLMKMLGAVPFAAARERGKLLGWRKAAALAGASLGGREIFITTSA